MQTEVALVAQEAFVALAFSSVVFSQCTVSLARAYTDDRLSASSTRASCIRQLLAKEANTQLLSQFRDFYNDMVSYNFMHSGERTEGAVVPQEAWIAGALCGGLGAPTTSHEEARL